MLMLQFGAAFSYYKLGLQTLLQIGAEKLLQNVIKNWGSYYKLQKPLLTKVAVITNWSKFITNCVRYYKLGQLLQIGT